ncbi:small ribosomal subunit protein mS23 [Anabrus simplex]|uniref:small ribosomal subunit protein mS23 n=1 Tax=Anabrus simplex TaxID=316456 RepID=UPI0035A39547
MASSRLEKVGTIFTRVTGLIRSGALKEEDKPIWYDIYKAFPPVTEPRYDRPAPNIQVGNIFYAEDQIRAKFHDLHRNHLGVIDMNDSRTQTASQRFLHIYMKLKKEGNLPEEKLFDAAFEEFKAERSFATERVSSEEAEVPTRKKSLVSTFREAQNKGKMDSNMNIDVKEIFKE